MFQCWRVIVDVQVLTEHGVFFSLGLLHSEKRYSDFHSLCTGDQRQILCLSGRGKKIIKDKSKRACITGNNKDTYFNVIARQVVIDQVLMAEHPK